MKLHSLQKISLELIVLLSLAPFAYAEDSGTAMPKPPLPPKPVMIREVNHGPLVGRPEASEGEGGEHGMASGTMMIKPPKPGEHMDDRMGSGTPPRMGDKRPPIMGSTTGERREREDGRMGSSSGDGRDRLKQQQLDNARKNVKRSVMLLGAAVDRADGLTKRIHSRLDKMPNIASSTAAAHLSDAEGKIADAKSKLEALKGTVDTATGATPQEAFGQLRDSVKGINDELKGAMDSIKKTVDDVISAAQAANANPNN